MPPPRAPDEVVSLAADGVVQVSAVAVTSPAPLTLGAALELKVTLDSSLPRDLLLVQGGDVAWGAWSYTRQKLYISLEMILCI